MLKLLNNKIGIMNINIKWKITNFLLLPVVLVFVFLAQNLLASQGCRSFFDASNEGRNMVVTANEYTLDQQNKGYRNFNQDTNAG
jgi:hypothetical protein